MWTSIRDLGESLDTAFSSSGPSTAHENRVIDIPAVGQLCLGPVFAEGGFSFVHTGDLTIDGASKPVAVKRMAVAEADARRRAEKEVDILSRVPPHPNVTAFYGSAFVGGDAYIALELVDGGTLPEFLDRRRTPMTAEAAVAIFFDVMLALTHLHAQEPPIACRDLKLENVLLDARANRFKLCDLGSASTVAKRYVGKEIPAAAEDIEENCSAPYRAPELCDLHAPDAFCCEKVDVWAAGCIWYALLFRELPFDGGSTMPILAGAYEERDMDKFPQYPPSFIKLLQAMLNPSVSKRADSFRVLEALCRLKGVEMDAKLKQAGLRLREKRKTDLCGQMAAPAAAATSALSFDDGADVVSSHLRPSPQRFPSFPSSSSSFTAASPALTAQSASLSSHAQPVARAQLAPPAPPAHFAHPTPSTGTARPAPRVPPSPTTDANLIFRSAAAATSPIVLSSVRPAEPPAMPISRGSNVLLTPETQPVLAAKAQPIREAGTDEAWADFDSAEPVGEACDGTGTVSGAVSSIAESGAINRSMARKGGGVGVAGYGITPTSAGRKNSESTPPGQTSGAVGRKMDFETGKDDFADLLPANFGKFKAKR